MGWGAIIGAVAGVLGGREQAKGAAEAAEMTAEMTRKAIESKRRMFDLAMALGKKYRGAGAGALKEMMGIAMSDKPSQQYMYEKKEGEIATRRKLRAEGKLRSGYGAKSFMDLESQVTNREYNRRYGKMIDVMNLGAGMSAQGMGAAGATGTAMAGTYMQGAANMSPFITGKGNYIANLMAGVGQVAGGAAQK